MNNRHPEQKEHHQNKSHKIYINRSCGIDHAYEMKNPLKNQSAFYYIHPYFNWKNIKTLQKETLLSMNKLPTKHVMDISSGKIADKIRRLTSTGELKTSCIAIKDFISAALEK
ncbi:MAG: hypothetical protein V7751_17580 [Pseudoalteromonas distincta]